MVGEQDQERLQISLRQNGAMEIINTIQSTDFYVIKGRLLQQLKQEGDLYITKHSADMDNMDIVPIGLISTSGN